MRPNPELTPEQVYWSNLIKPIIGVGRDESVELGTEGADGADDFASFLRRALDNEELADRAADRARENKIGYSH